ncbi:hypothetical protein QBC47DRAFT_393653 [Echria macrotheca]|uniref:Uncharacterized protein n=1 Tax=Echria macrotheca TaxID=438768 RepID=A0AAJ0F1Z2_9PEZI|nr:hypothetical protein QBC47DRAFT_393653 [Echria macrotheca]
MVLARSRHTKTSPKKASRDAGSPTTFPSSPRKSAPGSILNPVSTRTITTNIKMDSSRRPRQAVHHFSLRYLLIPPVLLALLTGFVLYQHSDTNLYMLYSQCHARSRIPWLSHIPLLGTPSCFLVSFFQEALSGSRAVAIMAPVLSLVAGLLTVSTVEAARICNSPSVLIAYPTGPWLVFNLIGGAIVWQLLIIPAFFHRSREILTARARGPSELAGPADPTFGESMRHLAKVAETVAIPVAVAVGCVLPSILMLTLDHPVVIFIWLFFPVWVSVVRIAVRRAVLLLQTEWHATFHLESSRLATAGMYAVPILCSAASHILLIVSLATQRDDRKEMTRAAIKFIVIDVFFIALTVLYWILVEAGWRVALVMLATSLVLGPGAGVCVGWVYREASVDPDRSVTVVAVGARPAASDSDAPPSEDTPLLR